MTLEGTFINGSIVLDRPAQLPEGTRVEVHVKGQIDKADSSNDRPTLTSLLKLAGIVKDLPEDFAAQHDHYIHGTTKR